MQHRHPAAVRLDRDALCRLNRFRRGTRQPLARIVNAIVLDFLDGVRSEPRLRGRRTSSRPRRRQT
ncbi:MAG: hypothetical protein AABO58_10865 [Acidobacteriota bacterium]